MFLGEKDGDRGGERDERAAHVHVDDGGDVLRQEARGAADAPDAGVGDDHVERPELVIRAPHRLGGRGGIRHVARDGERLAARLRDGVGAGRERGGATREDGHLRAAARVLEGERATDAARGAGDEDGAGVTTGSHAGTAFYAATRARANAV